MAIPLSESDRHAPHWSISEPKAEGLGSDQCLRNVRWLADLSRVQITAESPDDCEQWKEKTCGPFDIA